MATKALILKRTCKLTEHCNITTNEYKSSEVMNASGFMMRLASYLFPHYITLCDIVISADISKQVLRRGGQAS